MPRWHLEWFGHGGLQGGAGHVMLRLRVVQGYFDKSLGSLTVLNEVTRVVLTQRNKCSYGASHLFT